MIFWCSPFTDFTSLFFTWLQEWTSLALNFISSSLLGLIFSFVLLLISFTKCTFPQSIPPHLLCCDLLPGSVFQFGILPKQTTLVFCIIWSLLTLLVIFLLWKLFWLILLISQHGKQITAGSLKAWVESQTRRKIYPVCKPLFSLENIICSSIRLSFEAARSFYYSGLIASCTIISDFSWELLIAHSFLLK